MIHWIIKILKRNHSFHSKIHEEKNVVESIVMAKALYKKLIALAHPDKHPNKKEIAEDITMQINESRYNYKKLSQLESIIKKELG